MPTDTSPVKFPTAVLSTSARAKARASDVDKMQADSLTGEKEKV